MASLCTLKSLIISFIEEIEAPTYAMLKPRAYRAAEGVYTPLLKLSF